MDDAVTTSHLFLLNYSIVLLASCIYNTQDHRQKTLLAQAEIITNYPNSLLCSISPIDL